MKAHRFWQILMIVAVVANSSGCATYMPARLPRHFAVGGNQPSRDAQVAVGASARATLVSGDVVSGEVTAVSDSSLTIGRVGNYGLQERVIFAAELVRLEVEDQSGFASSAVGTVTGVVIVLTLGIIAIAATHDPVSEF